MVLCMAAAALPAFAKTWHVKADGALRSVQQAIINAAPGDTIAVYAGVYREKTITVDKEVYLKGIGYPVLDGEKKYEVLAIRHNDVVVDGFIVQHSGYSSYNDIAAIRIYNATGVIVRNNKLDDTFFGIYSQHATGCIISGNTLRSNATNEINSANGIHCWKSDSMQILNNTVWGHRDGIYFEFVTNSIIQGNKSLSNVRYGLHFMFSHNDSYIGNLFEENGAGVAVMFSHGVRMFKNTFTRNRGSASYGILLKEISDSRIEENQFSFNTVGIYMEGTSRIHIYHNAFDNNGWAMKVQASCTDDVISANNFMGNTFDVATNGSQLSDRFDRNYWDKYEGYDLDRNGLGDIPYRPVSVFAMIAERNPSTMMLYRSFLVTLLDRSEKLIPGIIPESLKDDTPVMTPIRW